MAQCCGRMRRRVRSSSATRLSTGTSTSSRSRRGAPLPPSPLLSASRQAGLLTPRVVLVGSSKSRTVDISANMTRQYKAMQDDFVAKIDEKEGKILELKDALELSKRGE